jgi:hypothetical protein
MLMTISILTVTILILYFLFFKEYVKRKRLTSFNGNIIYSSELMEAASRELISCVISIILMQILILDGMLRSVGLW